ncbi:MAG: methyltransferase domain-containing protein [Dermatophilaceae bacterium]
MFGPKFAHRVAARYRKRGLDPTARRMVEWLERQGLEGASVLEIGGGVGEIQIELLRRGAGSSVNLELSPAYDAEAARLLAESGLADRAQRRIGDIAVDGSVAETADIVILHRVVCCYPDAERLLSAAAAHATRAVVFSHPPRNLLSRGVLAVTNRVMRLVGREYQTYVHSPASMLATLRGSGFDAAHLPSGPLWQVVGAGRISAS